MHDQYGLNKEKAFNITLRVHRGGGFTKDYLYLTGLKKIYDHYRSGKDLGPLLTGKVSLGYQKQIRTLIESGLAVNPLHFPDSYAKNRNSDRTVDFILNNLK